MNSKNKARDAYVIEAEINNILDQLQRHKNSLDEDNYEKLLGQNLDGSSYTNDSTLQMLTHSNPYNESLNYYKEFWRFYMLNEVYIKTINDLSNYNKKLAELTEELGNLQCEFTESLSQRAKKKNRRTSQEIEKPFACPYEQCNKVYGSDVSLNLHMKLKHDGGNKTDREKFAKLIIEAQENGIDLPDVNIKFPPGYLDQFKDQLRKERSQSKVKSQRENNQVSVFYEDEEDE